MRIPVHHYIEITCDSRIAVIQDQEYYIKNSNGTQYLVEVWA